MTTADFESTFDNFPIPKPTPSIPTASVAPKPKAYINNKINPQNELPVTSEAATIIGKIGLQHNVASDVILPTIKPNKIAPTIPPFLL